MARPDEIVAIYPRDYEVKKFRSFQLTADALTSRDALEHFLYEQATSASCACTDLEVFDMEQWRTEVLQEYGGDVIGAALRKWFTYHILGADAPPKLTEGEFGGEGGIRTSRNRSPQQLTGFRKLSNLQNHSKPPELERSRNAVARFHSLRRVARSLFHLNTLLHIGEPIDDDMHSILL